MDIEEEDALSNQMAPTKRINLVPGARPIITRRTQRMGPKSDKKGARQTIIGTQKTTAPYHLFPELQQKDNNYTALLQENYIDIENTNAGPSRKGRPEQKGARRLRSNIIQNSISRPTNSKS